MSIGPKGECLIEVWCKTTEGRGSGYLLTPDLVLTACHIIVEEGKPLPTEIAVEVRTVSEARTGRPWRRAQIVWPRADSWQEHSKSDVALLKISEQGDGPRGIPMPKLGIGNLRTDCPAEITAAGFPKFKQKGDASETQQIHATIALLSGLREQALEIKYNGDLPRDEAGWKGISGAAVFAEDRIIGVLILRVRPELGSMCDFKAARLEPVLPLREFKALLRAPPLSRLSPDTEKNRSEGQGPHDAFDTHGQNSLVSCVTTREAGKLLREKKRRFKEECLRHRVMAESFSITEVLSTDGSGELICELKSLKVEDPDAYLNGVYFSIQTQAGSVGAPVPDKRALDLHITWNPDASREPSDMQALIDQVRGARGSFRFDQRLTKRNGPYTFGWSMRILNHNATTVWDFDNLYSPEQQYHVNGNRLDPPTEYLARLIWFPLKRLEMAVEVPSVRDNLPTLRYFGLNGESGLIPTKEIIRTENSRAGGEPIRLLCSFRRPDSDWYKDNAKWEANFAVDRIESAALRHDGKARSQLVIEYPSLGAFYSLNWLLPNPSITGKLERLIRGAREVRKGLLEHRKRRLNEEASLLSDGIAKLVTDIHRNLKDKFWSDAPKEIFETTLMTYDDEQRKLFIIEGRLNDGDLPKDSREYWLPFGLGLAGACFRRGAGLTYSRSLDVRTPSVPENYLPRPGSVPYEFLVTLPIDHPELDEEMSDIEDTNRSRQLIGIITIGSNFGASPLLEFVAPTEQTNQRLSNLRDECQGYGGEISFLLLGSVRPS